MMFRQLQAIPVHKLGVFGLYDHPLCTGLTEMHLQDFGAQTLDYRIQVVTHLDLVKGE